MDILARNSLSLLRQQSDSFTEFLRTSTSGVEGQLASSSAIVSSMSNTWERAWNVLRDVAVKALSGIGDEIKDAISGLIDYLDLGVAMLSGSKYESKGSLKLLMKQKKLGMLQRP